MSGNGTVDNNTEHFEESFMDSFFVTTSVLAFYAIFITGGFLDIFVIYVMVRSGQVRRNISSFLIFHLSFTHLLFHVVFAMTIPAGPLQSNNDTMCKMSSFIEHACPAAIFSTLAAIAWERRKNVLQPFKSLVVKSYKSYLLLVAVIWTYAVISSVSFVNSVTVQLQKDCWIENSTEKCEQYHSCVTPVEWNTHISETVYFLMAFFIPLSYMMVAYTRIAIRLWKRNKNGMIHSAVAKHKTKSIRLLLVAVFGFVVCWGPSIMMNFLAQVRVFDGLSFGAHFMLDIWFLFIGPASSSCVNMAIYAFLSPEFRKNCVKFGCCCCSFCRPCTQSCYRCRENRRVSPDGARMRANRTTENLRNSPS
ncbi:pyroglutamylated RF-amide peptide receptor-like [Oculina patagonica]